MAVSFTDTFLRNHARLAAERWARAEALRAEGYDLVAGRDADLFPYARCEPTGVTSDTYEIHDQTWAVAWRIAWTARLGWYRRRESTPWIVELFNRGEADPVLGSALAAVLHALSYDTRDADLRAVLWALWEAQLAQDPTLRVR